MREKLRNALFARYHELISNGVTMIKAYEIEFQDVIEELFPNKSWWNVTDCQIFMHLMEHKDPEKTIIAILDGLKED